ncbi:hypothetical protein IMCC20628_01885 [Hoeflea sp. IMCC20628]|uniref:hypothetical protein n=1 Tax=Hoeflea sp. IMCC20628 TaxID=1620421 RepID=UPI00063BF038|nr:hypothetical protein [Hoeflea sp. IMCC20628]AKI00591.1 hypothetical protein IMCC20628_01885 [Hoeflea sp. IMCC20628]
MNRLSTILLSTLALVHTAQLAQAQDAFGNEAGPKLNMPGLNQYAPADAAGAAAAHGRTVQVEAALTETGAPLKYGLTWRIFHPIPGPDGKLPLLATSEGGSAQFEFEPGEYFMHVAFGRAGVTKKLTVPKDGPMEKQRMVLEAGGLVLNAVSGIDARIPTSQLRFNIYKAGEGIDGEQQLVVEDVKPDTIVRLNAGTYHIVSEYGAVNAVIRSDIRVEAGKMTEAIIQHRAAQLTLKLVAEAGGEAIADTAWSILTSGGDVVSESVGAFPTIVLAEGEYTAIARNKTKVLQREFTVVAGQNSDVEVLLN